MINQNVYTQEQIEEIAKKAAKEALLSVNLGSRIEPSPEGENEMAKRLKQQIEINGVSHWISSQTIQGLLDSYLALCLDQGIVAPPIVGIQKPISNTPFFGPYLKNFNDIYKSKQQSLTKRSREQIVKKHIIPKWGSVQIDQIKTSDLQSWFNEMEENGYSHETLLKIKNNMNPALDAAVEDGYILKNPMRSTRLKIRGVSTKHHKAIPSEKFNEVKNHIFEIKEDRVRNMMILLCYTGMRLEEILGLKWEDIDFVDNWILIQRAVIHPTRNLPEVKCPKSVTSKRKIPLLNTIKEQFRITYSTGFVLYSDSDEERKIPLSYTESRRCIQKIRKMFDLNEYSAHDFRDSCATFWRESGIQTDVIARMLGHSKSDVTENRYVKYRDEIFQGVRTILDNQNGT